jgi:hypothetical protein
MKVFLAFGPAKSLGGLLLAGIAFWCLSYVLVPFIAQMKYELDNLSRANSPVLEKTSKTAESYGAQMTDNSVNTGAINITGNTSPTQVSIGSPNSKQVINQQRKFIRQAQVEKLQKDGAYLIRVIINQTSGIWDQGTQFQFSVQLTGSYKEARIVQGLPPAQMMVTISENKEKGYYSYSTITAPYPDRPIVFEAVTNKEVDLKAIAVAPLADE